MRGNIGNQNKMRAMQGWKRFLAQRMRSLLNIKGNSQIYKQSRRRPAKNARKGLIKRQQKEATRKLKMGIGSLNAED